MFRALKVSYSNRNGGNKSGNRYRDPDFEFDGNIYYSNEELKEVIKEAINTELGYDQLIDVTRAISNHYRASGFLATALITLAVTVISII